MLMNRHAVNSSARETKVPNAGSTSDCARQIGQIWADLAPDPTDLLDEADVHRITIHLSFTRTDGGDDDQHERGQTDQWQQENADH